MTRCIIEPCAALVYRAGRHGVLPRFDSLGLHAPASPEHVELSAGSLERAIAMDSPQRVMETRAPRGATQRNPKRAVLASPMLAVGLWLRALRDSSVRVAVLRGGRYLVAWGRDRESATGGWFGVFAR